VRPGIDHLVSAQHAYPYYYYYYYTGGVVKDSAMRLEKKQCTPHEEAEAGVVAG
jgi:hypothetical protein